MTTTNRTPRYKWDHPSEWLEQRIQTLTTQEDHIELASIAHALAGRLDGDSIQDLFQAEMDDDGYFQDLNRCPDCDGELTQADNDQGLPANYCTVCDREVAL